MTTTASCTDHLLANIASLRDRLAHWTAPYYSCSKECSQQVAALDALRSHVEVGARFDVRLFDEHRDIFEHVGAIGYRVPESAVESELREFWRAGR